MIRSIASVLLLFFGVALSIIVTPTYLFLVGAPVALSSVYLHQFRRYALDVWLGFDKFINAAMGGDHRETVSSRLGKSVHHDGPSVFGFKAADRLVSSCLDVVDPDHCAESVDWSVGRKYK